jgi:hypothetical protein
VRRLLGQVERWYRIAEFAEHPPLRVAIRASADGTQPAIMPSTESISIRTVHGGECEWEHQFGAAEGFADDCLASLLREIA